MLTVSGFERDLNNLESSYKQIVVNNLVFTGPYDDSFCSCFIDKLENYVLSINGYELTSGETIHGFDPVAISAISSSMQTVCN